MRFHRRSSRVPVTFLFAAMLLAGLSPAALAVTYYVSTSGSDSSSGTSSQPFRTIRKAIDVARSGDTVQVGAGTYYERITMKSGVTLQGQRGSNKEWLSVLNGSDALPSNAWVSAPEVGSGVYKSTVLPYNPQSLVKDGSLTIWKIAKSYMDGTVIPSIGYTGFQILALSANAQISEGYTTVAFWDGIEAWFGTTSAGITYIRFRNGANPNSLNLRSSPGPSTRSSITNSGAGIALFNVSDATIRNLEIAGANVAIHIHGSGSGTASHNIIENNHLTNGVTRVNITGKATNNIVRNNLIEMRSIGGETYGSNLWEYNPWAASHKIAKQHLYFQDKFTRGESNEFDAGIRLWQAGQGAGALVNNQIYGNDLYRNGMGIAIDGGDNGLKIYGNNIRWSFSQNLLALGSSSNVEIYDNLITSGGQYQMRMNNGDSTAGPYYIYGNRLWHNSDTVGNGFSMFKFKSQAEFLPTVWFYHNTICGGVPLNIYHPSPNLRIINNIFSTNTLLDIRGSAIDVFDYNWTRVSGIAGGTHNIVGSALIWSNTSFPDFQLPSGHAARAAGLDLSTNFSVQGKSFSRLPGCAAGYFSGARPSMGIFQSAIAIPSTPTGVHVINP